MIHKMAGAVNVKMCVMAMLMMMFISAGADDLRGNLVRERRADGVTGTTLAPSGEPKPHDNSTIITLTEAEKGDKLSVGALIGIIIGGLIAVALIAIIVFVLFKLKKQRSSNMERDAKIQMSTAKNAGVYVDLTTNPEPEDKEVKETDKLQAEEA